MFSEMPSVEGGASQDAEYEIRYTDQGTTTTCRPQGEYLGETITTDRFLTGLRVVGYDKTRVASAVGKGRNIFDISFRNAVEALGFQEKYGPKGGCLKIGQTKYKAEPARPIAKSVKKPWTAVFVSGVAVCIDDKHIISKVNQYADVKACFRLTHKNHPGIENGTRKVMIANQKKNIPERIYVEGCRAWVALRGAIKCFECGLKGHIAKDCKMERTSALAKSSTWASKRDSNQVSVYDTENNDIESEFPPLRRDSPTEKTMKYIDNMHEHVEGGTELSQGGPEGTQGETTQPSIPESDLTNVTNTEMALDDSWTGEWPTPPRMKVKGGEGGETSQGVEPEGATAEEDATTQALPLEHDELEEGEIIEAESPVPESPIPERVASKGDGETEETPGAEVFHSFTSTPINSPKTERQKKEMEKKIKRKREQGSNSGDRGSSELKRQTLSRTEAEMMVDLNIRKVLGGKYLGNN